MKNPYQIIDNEVHVSTFHKGKESVFIFDLVDLPFLQSFKNTFQGKQGYLTYRKTVDGKRITQFVHRLLVSAPYGLHVDHIDRNTFNNKRSNLRIVTRSENNLNRTLQVSNITNEKHISFQKGKYMFEINRVSKRARKQFKTLEQAIEYRDRYLRESC